MPLIPIPDDWDGESWCCYVIDWPSSDRWRAIFTGQLTAPSKGRFWDERTGIITDAQSIGLEIFARNFLGDCMGCQDWITSFAGIADAIRDSSCCGTTGGGVGLQEIAGEFYYGNESSLDEPTTFGGATDEFGTEAAYLSHKCQAANEIVTGLINTLNNWAVLTLASVTAGAVIIGIASATLVAVPIAALLALAYTGFLFASLQQMSVAIDENRQEIVCALYGADSAIAAYDAMTTFLDGLAVDLGFAEISITALIALLQQLAPIDTFNKLFVAIGLPASDGSEVDCDVCGLTPWWTCLLGDVVTYDENSVTVDGVLLGDGVYWASISVAVAATLQGSQSGWTVPGSVPTFSSAVDYDNTVTCGTGGGGTWDNRYSNFNSGPFTSAYDLLYRSGTAFRVTFDRS